MVGKGRPNEGERIEVRIPPDVLAKIDTRAAAQGVSRASAIRSILKEAVK